MIVKNESEIQNFQSLKTINCYCLHYNYSFKLVSENNHPEISKNCHQKDFMFRRHCILARYAHKYEHFYDYIFFVDDSIGVINPQHSLEEYLPRDGEQIIFYDRIYNNEISSQSYVFKNTQYSREFLFSLANYQFKKSIYNFERDNVALCSALLDKVIDSRYFMDYKQCMNMWSSITKFNDGATFVSCIKRLLEKYDEKNNTKNYASFDNNSIVVLSKNSKRRWIRDAWLTSWKFCENDFLYNDWKIENIYEYSNIFTKEFNPNDYLCRNENFINEWSYKKGASTDCITVDKTIQNWIDYSHEMHINILNSKGMLN